MPLPVRNKLVNPNAQNPLAELQEIKNKEVEHLDNLIKDLDKITPNFNESLAQARESLKLLGTGVISYMPKDEKYSHLESIGIKEMKPYKPDFSTAVVETEKALVLAEQGAVRKSNKSKDKSSTELFLEELHTLIESWNPQATDWPGERRPILYDFECKDEIRKLMVKYGF